jgi:hypothetical protein
MGRSERIKRAARLVGEATKSVIADPKEAVGLLASRERERAHEFTRSWPVDNLTTTPVPAEANPLLEYFEANRTGPGIYKWRHYFEPYLRHLAKFVGKADTLVEIGVYSGGSLPMWRSYLGPDCHVHGIDIEPTCKVYETDGISIEIGDQGDRAFWADFRERVPDVDIVIDDGGHLPEQQIVTLEEMLPHLRPGGVLMIEDIHGTSNHFTQYALGLVDELNECAEETPDIHGFVATPFQRAIHSIHFYPYLLVIEKHASCAPSQFEAPKHGTEWQPFLEPR